MRYGTVPIVRTMGDLADTVTEDTGFRFDEYSAEALLKKALEVVRLYRDSKVEWMRMVTTAMGKDYSWAYSAREYSRLYAELAGQATAISAN